MALPRVLVLVLAGGAGGRLELLTEQRAKPAVPFAGVYRLIDFPLSNCQHSQLPDVWVSVQHHPASLSRHLANGRPWDLDRTEGGLLVLPPYQGTDRGGWVSGTAHSLWRYSPLIRDFAADALVVLSADAVYKLDYREVADAHLESGAEVTMVTTEVAADDASRYGVVEVGEGDRITSYAYKPDEPASAQVSNEVFAFAPEATLDLLDELGQDAGDEGLQDFGSALLPRLVEAGRARALPFDGYWRDVGTLPAYWSSHQDLLGAQPAFDLEDRSWSVRTREAERPPARVLAGASVADSLLSGGAVVAGTVERSVLSPGAVVEPGAVVRDAVVLHGAVVRAGAVVQRAIVDEEAGIGEGARVGGTAGDLALVGRRAVVPPGAEVPPGEHRGR